jgi:hypothetical protein
VLGELPATLFLLVPGFLGLRAFLIASYERRLTQTELVLWSLVSAFAVIIPATALWHEWFDGPSFQTILVDPTKMHTSQAIVMYIVPPVAGALLGAFDSRNGLNWVLRRLGIDPSRSQDVWQRVLVSTRPHPFARRRQAHFVQIRLNSGEEFYGYPRLVTENRSGTAEILLQKVRFRRNDQQEWVALPRHAALVDASQISSMLVEDGGTLVLR